MLRVVAAEAVPSTWKARCTTTSAPAKAASRAAGSRTSPCRYASLDHPCVAGSNGRRAMPATRPIRSSASSSGISPKPNVPVGPVTATASSGSEAPPIGPTVPPGRPLRRGGEGPNDRSDRLRHLAGAGEDEPHDLVAGVGGRLEHQRAAAVDDGHAALAAIDGGGVADAPIPERAVHPHLVDAERLALADRGLGPVGPRGDDDRVDAAGDVVQRGIAPVALDLLRVGIDGEDLVAAVPQPLVDDVAAVVLRVARHTGDRDPVLGEERGRSFLDGGHDRAPLSSVPP